MAIQLKKRDYSVISLMSINGQYTQELIKSAFKIVESKACGNTTLRDIIILSASKITDKIIARINKQALTNSKKSIDELLKEFKLNNPSMRYRTHAIKTGLITFGTESAYNNYKNAGLEYDAKKHGELCPINIMRLALYSLIIDSLYTELNNIVFNYSVILANDIIESHSCIDNDGDNDINETEIISGLQDIADNTENDTTFEEIDESVALIVGLSLDRDNNLDITDMRNPVREVLPY